MGFKSYVLALCADNACLVSAPAEARLRIDKGVHNSRPRMVVPSSGE